MEQARLRACTPNDIDGVIALERQWEQEDIAYGDFNPMSREAYVAILDRFPAYFLVAESDGQLVGYIHASVQRNNPVEVIPAHEPYVAIEDIYVQPGYRDRDIGGALLERIFEVAWQEGIQRFIVGTLSKETDRILKFYRSHGFTPWRYGSLSEHKVVTMTTQRFTAIVAKEDSRTYIAIPFNPNEVWGVKQRHHITGSINGCTIRGSLGSDGSQYFLPLGAAWRRDNGVEAGAEVEVVLTPEGPQVDALAADILAALESEPEARAFFESLATFYRNGYIRWIESAKRPETRSAPIAEMLSLLKAGKKQR